MGDSMNLKKNSVLLLVVMVLTPFVQVDLEKIPVALSKINFLNLYKKQWQNLNMDAKLNQTVNDAFDEQSEKLMWGTKGIQIGINRNNIIENIQRAIDFKFYDAYDNFLDELESAWGEQLKAEILAFYQRSNADLLFDLSDNPMVQAYLRQDYDMITEDKGSAIMNNVASELSTRYPALDITGAKFITGSLILLARKRLITYITNSFMRKAAGSALGRIINGVVPVIGLAMIAWSAWDIYSLANEAEDTAREKLYAMNQAMYTEEIPAIYWENMESYVRDAFIFAYDKLVTNVNDGLIIERNPKIQQLLDGKSKLDERIFYDRIALIRELLNIKLYEINDLIYEFGETIRDANAEEFQELLITLRERRRK